MLKIRRPNGRLIFNMEIALPRDKKLFILKRGPGRIPSWDRVSRLVNQFIMYNIIKFRIHTELWLIFCFV